MNMNAIVLAGGLFLAAVHTVAENTERAVQSVHERLRTEFSGPHGLLLDFRGEIPTQ